MTTPTLDAPRRVAEDTDAISTHLPLPMGHLPVNAFLVHAAEPVLVDTGVPSLADDFVAAVRSRIDLEELRWIWITHADLDHTGALAELLRLAPSARVVTTFLGMGKLNMAGPLLSPARVWLIRPGQRLSVGDRELLAVRPPTFDAPETLGLADLATGAYFAADAFGALLPAPVRDVAEVSADDLRAGGITWATIDSPWIHTTEPEALVAAITAVEALRPSRILGAHLPPASGELLATLGRTLLAARSAERFAGPDQHDLIAMVASQAA